MLAQEKVQQKSATQKSIKIQEQQPGNSLIVNYYGAHKTYKTDFRNKKFKHVYNQLIHRRPAQLAHQCLYYEDLLISIIKTIEWSFYTKQNFIQNIQPFYHFGKKAIKQFYASFLVEKRIIDEYAEIDGKKIRKISTFFSLLIQFSGKMGFFLKEERDYGSAQKILDDCYMLIIKKILSSSTSNIRLLKKCTQFFLIYTCFSIQREQYNKLLQIIQDTLTLLMNLIILIKFTLKKSICKKKPTKKYIKILQLIVKTLMVIAFYAENRGQYQLCYEAIQDCIYFEKIIKNIWPKYSVLTAGIGHIFENQFKSMNQLQIISNQYFSIEQIQKLKPIQLKPYYPYRFCLKYPDSPHPKKQPPKNPYFFNNFFAKKNLQKTQKQVRFKGTNSQIFKKIKRPSMELVETKKQKSNIQKFKSCITSSPTSSKQLINLGEEAKLADKIFNEEEINKFWSVQDFKTLVKPKRTLSIEYPSSVNIEEIVRSSKRKLSYNKNEGIQKKMTTPKFYSSKENLGFLKKRSKFSSIDFNKKKAPSKHLPYDNVEQKVGAWHKQAINIETQMTNKLNKLRQKKSVFKIEQQGQVSKSEQNQLQIPQSEANKLSLQNIQKNSIKNSKNLKGINLLRSIILEHKKYFKVYKPQLFTIKNQNSDLIKLNMSRKSLLLTEDEFMEMKIDQKLQKNHERANKNIEFFMKSYENSMHLIKTSKIKAANRQKQNIEKIHQSNMFVGPPKKSKNSQLFISSLKPSDFLSTT